MRNAAQELPAVGPLSDDPLLRELWERRMCNEEPVTLDRMTDAEREQYIATLQRIGGDQWFRLA